MEQNQIITVMGSPGAGKTTTSIKLALELAGGKKNVVLVFCDPFTPVVPFVVPCPQEQVSIGELLTAPSLTQKMILDACIPIKDSGYISLLGYRSGESLMAYPQITRERAVDFMVCLRYLADYIIMDCSAIYEADVLSMVAMELSDQFIKLGTSNLRGISYFEPRRMFLSDQRFQPERQLFYLGNVRAGQEWEAVSEQYGGVNGALPYVAGLEVQYDELALFEPLAGKESAAYLEEIRKLSERLSGSREGAKTEERTGRFWRTGTEKKTEEKRDLENGPVKLVSDSSEVKIGWKASRKGQPNKKAKQDENRKGFSLFGHKRGEF